MAVWRENDAAWFEERMLHCALCGRMIAKRYLAASSDHDDAIFCSKDCFGLYDNYWLPERGAGYRPPTDVADLYAGQMVK